MWGLLQGLPGEMPSLWAEDMSWVKLDDGFADHPKVLAVSGDAVLLHLALSQLTRFSKPKAAKLAAKLVEVGLWERNGAGYAIHDYLEYNPSKKSLDEKRKAARERMAKK